MILNPYNTTAGDLCRQALKESGGIGVGQSPLADDIIDAQFRLQIMLQEWQRKTWMVPNMVNVLVQATGQVSYSVGPGGDFDTGPGSARPAKLESAFLRQLVAGGGHPSQPVDYPLEIIQSMPDYNRVTLKQLTSFTGAVYYQPTWPLGTAYPVPIPQASLYSLGLCLLASLPALFNNPASVLEMPFEYYAAILYNLALRCRPKFGLGTFPGDMLPGLAKDALNTVRSANFQIARLTMPGALLRPGIYNIFSDRSY